MDRIKLIRDLVIGDGSLYRNHPTKNSGATLSISHSKEQMLWIDWKHRRMLKIGIKCKFYQDKGGKYAYRLRSTVNQEFRRLWDEWYFWDESHKRFEKDYFKLLSAAKVDEETLAILFLDNGSRGIKRSYTCYKTGRRCEIEPYIERFKLSVGRRDQDPIIAMLASFGIEAKKSREGTGNGEVQVGKNQSKLILKNILHTFCLKHDFVGTFGYKYQYPISMKDVQRLSELAPIVSN